MGPGVVKNRSYFLVRLVGILIGTLSIVSCVRITFGDSRPSFRAVETKQKLSFNETIQPILSENCYACHGPDPGSRKAGLRLDRGEYAFAPHEKSGPAIIPGNPDKSPLVQKIEATNPKDRMPPPEAHKTLSAEQIVLLRQWVKEGAVYQEHWAFISPQRPALPDTKHSVWVKNAIDSFVLARLTKEGLAPSMEADRRTLIRRVTYDLTGLPPTAAEVESFVKDDSANAYENLVDQLMASARYGEHRAHYWLDYARYADTVGLHFDNYRSVWPYRDYVINSFNENKRFDQFVREQLAGDLLPAESVGQLVATGFNRIHVTSNEGGAIPEELQFNLVKDRVETTSTVFMGLTMGCAVCHDHKFDPLKQKEFYQFSAFFNNTADKWADDSANAAPPIITVPRPENLASYDRKMRDKAVIIGQLMARQDKAEELIRAWLDSGGAKEVRQVTDEKLRAWFPFDEGKGNLVHNRASGAIPATFEMTGVAPHWGEVTKFWPALRFATGTSLVCSALGNFESTDGFTIAGWFQPRHVPQNKGNALKGAFLSRMNLDGSSYRGWDLYWDGEPYDEKTKSGGPDTAAIAVHLAHAGSVSEILVRTKQKFDRAEWKHFAFSYDGSRKAAGVKIYVNGEPQELDIVSDTLDGSIRTDAPLQFGKRTDGEPFGEARYQDVRIYARVLDPEEFRVLANEDIAKRILNRPRTQWSEDEAHVIRELFSARFDRESLSLRNRLNELEPKLKALEEGGTPTLISEEKSSLPEAHVLERGVYSALKERVFPDVPHVLPRLPAGTRHDRLGLAEWLVSPEHPLLARVTVNRMWQEIFGTGIVETAEDFGVMGARPSHPELLDWLAVEFRESGWNVKHLYKLIVMSATYSQSAKALPSLLDKDPQNRLLARGPRFRMDAEMVRDSALAVSGLLIDRIGGASVKPYQPPGLWEAVSMTTDRYEADKGDGLYRRSLYTYWKRTSPPPVLETFNAPHRESCLVRRERTNTPLQALVTLNAPDFLEAARVLAIRALREGGSTDESKMQFVGLRVLGRPLKERELGILYESLEIFRRTLPRNPAGEGELLSIGETPLDPSVSRDELASWMMVASEFMNLDEAVNK